MWQASGHKTPNAVGENALAFICLSPCAFGGGGTLSGTGTWAQRTVSSDVKMSGG
jgi:hypothetical protein